MQTFCKASQFEDAIPLPLDEDIASKLEANRLLTKVWPAAGPVCITRPNKCGKDQGYLRAN